MPMNCRVLALAVSALVLASCSSVTPQAPVAQLKDGELAVPANYRSWPKFLSAVQRPDAKQVREIYMNTVATGGTAANGFPNGTVFVMENFAAAENPNGTLKQGPDGKLVKAGLLRVFVMGKNEGWGASAPDGLNNGDWIYAAYLAGGEKAPDSTLTCRACHLPLTASKDFVHRYDEHFSKAAAAR
ncbi:MAG: cytochrome P460 family protein [Burkholderiaceae bacterium]